MSKDPLRCYGDHHSVACYLGKSIWEPMLINGRCEQNVDGVYCSLPSTGSYGLVCGGSYLYVCDTHRPSNCISEDEARALIKVE
jgi:hypothetical protein